jgi:hypothetical protein
LVSSDSENAYFSSSGQVFVQVFQGKVIGIFIRENVVDSVADAILIRDLLLQSAIVLRITH